MKYIRMMLIGMLISLSASYGTIALFNQGVVFTGEELFHQFIIALILGPVIGIGSTIFQLERIPFPAQLFIHFVYVTITVLIAGKFGGWYDSESFLTFGKVLLIEIVIYILVWLFLYIMAERDIAEINEKIKRRRRTEQ